MPRVIVANITWNDAGWTNQEVHQEARHRYVKDKPGHECLNFVFHKKDVDSGEWINGFVQWKNAPTRFENGGLIIFCSTDIHDWKMKIVGVYGRGETLARRMHANFIGFEDGHLITNIRGKPELSLRFPVYLLYKDLIRSKSRPGEVGFSYVDEAEAVAVLEAELKECNKLPDHQETVGKIKKLLSDFTGKPYGDMFEELKKQQVAEEQVQEDRLSGFSREEREKQMERYRGNDDLSDDKPAIRATVAVYQRDANLSALKKTEAGFLCQVCKQPTFESDNGKNFVETHHVLPRGMKGSDDPRNIIVVCPNCHSKFDFGSEKVKIGAYRTLRRKGLFTRFDLLRERGMISQRIYDEIMK
ncbi:MAG: HNH endonuclease [Nitrososphaera sp.]